MTEQTRIGSLVEACLNTAIGFMVTLALTPIVYPLFGHSFTLAQNLGITAVFTAASVLRGYAVRRWFAARIRAAALRVQRVAEGEACDGPASQTGRPDGGQHRNTRNPAPD